jgi:hypothetical protein
MDLFQIRKNYPFCDLRKRCSTEYSILWPKICLSLLIKKLSDTIRKDNGVSKEVWYKFNATLTIKTGIGSRIGSYRKILGYNNTKIHVILAAKNAHKWFRVQ